MLSSHHHITCFCWTKFGGMSIGSMDLYVVWCGSFGLRRCRCRILNVRWQLKFKTDGTELPATEASSRYICCTNSVQLQSCSDNKKQKVNCTLVQALRLCTGRTAHRGSRGIALLFLDHGTRRGEGSASRPGRSSPPGKSRYTLYRRLGGPQGRSGQVRKISPPPGFDPRTGQPVASRYTAWAIPAHVLIIH